MIEPQPFADAVQEIVAGLRDHPASHGRLNRAAFDLDQLGRQLHGMGCVREQQIGESLTAAVRELGGAHELPEAERRGPVSNAIRHLESALFHLEAGGVAAPR